MLGKRFLKGTMATLLAVLLVMGANSPSQAAGDYDGHWAAAEIEALIGRRIVAGDENGDINPDNSITRAEFAALVNRTFGFTREAMANFPDVRESKWYFRDMAIAKEVGYMLGDDAGNVNPEMFITRGEMSVILARALELDISVSGDTGFADGSEIPAWAQGAVIAMKELAIIDGFPDGTFRAGYNLTRAEGFAVIMRILDKGLVTIHLPEDPDVPLDPSPAKPVSLSADRTKIITGDSVTFEAFLDAELEHGAIVSVDIFQTPGTDNPMIPAGGGEEEAEEYTYVLQITVEETMDFGFEVVVTFEDGYEIRSNAVSVSVFLSEEELAAAMSLGMLIIS